MSNTTSISGWSLNWPNVLTRTWYGPRRLRLLPQRVDAMRAVAPVDEGHAVEPRQAIVVHRRCLSETISAYFRRSSVEHEE